MTLAEELRLSYYREIADIEASHGVSLVQDIRTKKIYVKKILTVYDPEIYRYLMAHPIAHTPKFFEVVEDRNRLTVIEEYIPGDTLEELLEQKGPLTEAEVTDIAIQLCRILECFHSCVPPIVNRDIKPSNLKLTGDGIVKLVDLNAAKRCKEDSRKDTVLIGTQGYAAPEQYGFGASGVQTDVYAVGVLIRVLLTGSLTEGQIVNGRLRHIVSRCTQLSPKSRYQSIASVRMALEYLRGERTHPQIPAWRRFLPPGFQSGDPAGMCFAGAGYALLLWLCMTLEVENAGAAELRMNRIAVTVIFLAIILFSGNYLDIQSKVVLTKSKYVLVRFLGILVVDAVILLLGVAALSVAVSVFL